MKANVPLPAAAAGATLFEFAGVLAPVEAPAGVGDFGCMAGAAFGNPADAADACAKWSGARAGPAVKRKRAAMAAIAIAAHAFHNPRTLACPAPNKPNIEGCVGVDRSMQSCTILAKTSRK
ncbi:MAG: hypothetical protein NVS3B20_07890 [Polyangiales bacterium]